MIDTLSVRAIAGVYIQPAEIQHSIASRFDQVRNRHLKQSESFIGT
jgi:hypothetical protein